MTALSKAVLEIPLFQVLTIYGAFNLIITRRR